MDCEEAREAAFVQFMEGTAASGMVAESLRCIFVIWAASGEMDHCVPAKELEGDSVDLEE